MEYPTVPIAITNSPTDWPIIYSAFAAAFLGAMSAFILNILLERARERQHNLDKINAAIYGLLMSVATLVNLKEQFLLKFGDEFGEALNTLTEISAARDKATADKGINRFNLILQSIDDQDNQLNGAFILWQVPDFPMTPSPDDFHFTVAEDGDIVRLIHIAKMEMNGISNAIQDRNLFWRANVDPMIQEKSAGQFGIKNVTFNFQMLSFRSITKEHVDVALVVAKEALDRIEKYRKSHLQKRKWYSRWFFMIFTRKEVWATYEPSERMKRFIPDKTAYKKILES